MTDLKIKSSGSLIDYLTRIGYTRTKVKQLVKHRAIKVNGSAAGSHDMLLSEGDSVSVSKEGRDKRAAKAVPPMGIKVIYEDEGLIVIEKPAGLLTIASEKEKEKTAYFQLNEFFRLRKPSSKERVFIIHRLDRETSGLIVFAKNEKVKKALQEGWAEVDKRYYAVVEGSPLKAESEIKSFLKETKSLKVYSDRHSKDGKPAVTKYRVIRRGPSYSLLEIVLETGRKNQIRVHLSDIGHPVAGDKKYGAKANPFKRLGLHACLLSFRHPVTGARLHFKSKLPGEFSAYLTLGLRHGAD
ncbi:MAG: RluA family pseudouridine synthase [Nitrospirae bacterium]|nr:RluA family pseudouridine synthase [Nitrospirota bacterium]